MYQFPKHVHITEAYSYLEVMLAIQNHVRIPEACSYSMTVTDERCLQSRKRIPETCLQSRRHVRTREACFYSMTITGERCSQSRKHVRIPEICSKSRNMNVDE